MGHPLALQIGHGVERAGRFDNGQQIVALHLVPASFGGKRHCSCQIDGKAGRSGREARKMQTARPHRLDFSRIGLDGVIDDFLAHAFFEKIGERFEHIGIDGGVFDRRIGPDQRARIAPLFRVFRDVGHQILVLVAILRVELAAMAALVRRLGLRLRLKPDPCRQCDSTQQGSACGLQWAHRVFSRFCYPVDWEAVCAASRAVSSQQIEQSGNFA